MIEALQYSAGVMFWGLVNVILTLVWAVLIGGLISRMIGRKDE